MYNYTRPITIYFLFDAFSLVFGTQMKSAVQNELVIISDF